MLRISMLIIFEILPYLFSMLVMLLTFALLFYSLFYDENEAFESYTMSFRTLFDFMIGNVDFELFKDKTGEGMWLTFLWVLLSTIMALNILIALLNENYGKLAPKPRADYIANLYQHWTYNRYVPGYGGFTLCILPLNSLFILAMPLYFTRYRKAIDKYICIATYSIWLILGITIFIIYNIIQSLFTYFYIIGRIFYEKSFKRV